jgi:shikimate kinase
MKKNIIYLTGFMGAGKSTIGSILANTLGWEYYDLDKIIEEHTRKKIREIFEKHGDAYFREIEREQLKRISTGDNLIISLGGGTISSGNNLELLKKNGQIIYLKTSVESVYNRLLYKNDRPLLKINELDLPKEEILEKINAIFRKRQPFYEQADFIIETENVSVGKTVDLLAKIINNHLKGRQIEENNC